MAIQLFVLIGIGAWIGQKLDKMMKTSSPYMTILLIFLFTAVFFYTLIKDLSGKDEP